MTSLGAAERGWGCGLRAILLAIGMSVLTVLASSCGGSKSGSSSEETASVGQTTAAASEQAPSERLSERGASSWTISARAIPGVQQRFVGRKTEGAMVLWRQGARPSRRVVVFLHGWRPRPPAPSIYSDWLQHLVEEGNTVVYPVSEAETTPPGAVLDNTLVGISKGLALVGDHPTSVIMIGHVTGGAIAFEYAAVARQRGLPVPGAVIAVYPSHNPPSGEMPLVGLGRIPPSTRLTVMAGPGDPIPNGTAEAQALLRAATRVPSDHRRLFRVAHKYSQGPIAVSSAPRRSFWTLADQAIHEVRARRQK